MENNPLDSDNNKAQVLFNTTSALPKLNPSDTPDESNLSRADSNVMAAAIKENMQDLLKEMSELRQDFNVKVKYDESKERLITNLHKELQFYRDGFHFRILKPMFIDLISLYDDLSKFIDGFPQDSSAPNTQLIRHLVLFQEAIEDMLHRNGVDTFTCEQETFQPSKQRNLRVITTSDPTQDKRIARRVRPGLEYNSKLLRHEIVETYKYASAT